MVGGVRDVVDAPSGQGPLMSARVDEASLVYAEKRRVISPSAFSRV